MSAHTPGERWKCAACSTPLVGGLTEREKVAPVEEAPSDTGNVLLQRHADGVVVAITFGNETAAALRHRGVELRLNHFASCPERARFERAKTTTNEGTGTT